MDKRKCSVDSSTENISKKLKVEKSEGNGILVQDNLPDNVFALGDCVFVVVSIFQRNVIVHIRRYRQFGEKYYPTSTGITLKPDWVHYIMGRTSVPNSNYELRGGLYLPEEQIKISSENFTHFIFERFTRYDHKAIAKKIEITYSQWTEMISGYDSIAWCVLQHQFRIMNFIDAYMQFSEGVIDETLPSSLDVSLGQESALTILRNSLYDMFIEDGLKKPVKMAEELWANKEKTFLLTASNIDVMDLANRFYCNLMDSKNFLLLKPVAYVTKDFLKNIRLDNILQEVKTNLCPPYTFEYFEDHDHIDL